MKIPRINTYVLLGLLLGSGGLLGTMVASQGKAPLIFSSNPSTSQLCSKETKQTRTSKQTGISICDAMKQKPGTPVEVKAAPSIGKTVISWQANCGDIIRYTVYRRLATNEYTKIYIRDPDQALEDNNAPGQYQFMDKKVTPHQNYYYAVTVTSSLGMESDKAETGLIATK